MEKKGNFLRYSDLPYDILHLICLASLDCRADDQSALWNLSLADRRTRDMAIPMLFRHLSFKPTWLNTSNEHLDDLIDAVRRNDSILRVAR